MNPASDHVHVPVREKKTKLLHFSDGVEEVTDEDEVDGDEPEIEEPQSLIDEVSLSLQSTQSITMTHPVPFISHPPQSTMEWMPWLMLKSRQTGDSLLSGCEYVGEFLASAMGITSPKFIDGELELRKAAAEQQERDEEAAEEIHEMGRWKVDTQSTTTTVTEPRSPSPILLHEEVTERPSQTNRY